MSVETKPVGRETTPGGPDEPLTLHVYPEGGDIALCGVGLRALLPVEVTEENVECVECAECRAKARGRL